MIELSVHCTSYFPICRYRLHSWLWLSKLLPFLVAGHHNSWLSQRPWLSGTGFIGCFEKKGILTILFKWSLLLLSTSFLRNWAWVSSLNTIDCALKLLILMKLDRLLRSIYNSISMVTKIRVLIVNYFQISGFLQIEIMNKFSCKKLYIFITLWINIYFPKILNPTDISVRHTVYPLFFLFKTHPKQRCLAPNSIVIENRYK